MASSSDEGEIIENGVEDQKATSLPQLGGNGVDRRDRHRSRHSRSPEHDDPGYGGSSHRGGSPRGSKRYRVDERDSHHHHNGRSGADPRRFRVHYEDDHPRPRQYEDLDRPPSRGSSRRYDDLDRPASRDASYRYDDRDPPPPSIRYDDRDRHPGKRQRIRSRSPYSSSRNDRGRRVDRFRGGEQLKSIKYSAHNDRSHREGSAPRRSPLVEAGSSFKDVAKSDKGAAAEKNTNGLATRTVSEPAKAPEPKPDPKAEKDREGEGEGEGEWPIDEEAEIERRRRRREEILRKSRASTPLHLLNTQDKGAATTPGSTEVSTPLRTEINSPRSGVASPALSGSGQAEMQDVLSPDALNIVNDQDLINTHGETKVNDEDGPSAADYDPTFDMQEDERRDELRHGNVGWHGEERPETTDAPVPEKMEQPVDEPPGNQGDDDFDMFADDFDEDKYAVPKAEPKASAQEETPAQQGQMNGGILEGDDKDGYYKVRPGEVMNGRYQVQSMLGKGMFSGVARAIDITTKQLVAIKIMRNNDALRKGGFTEIAILEKLNNADPENKKHIVKFERSFEYKAHLCMAFENLSLNLREVLKKFGNNVGINLKGTRAYAYQIFVALGHMRKCSIIHADLKPDNILVNEARNILKICDLGTAIDRSDAATAHNEITPYLISRFYRAPEIILGMPYDSAVDMWSIGCTLYELYTGKILFTGDSNNQMLKAIMEVRGKMSGKIYRRGELWAMHFDEMGNFVSQERDKILGKTTVKVMNMVKPTRDLRTRLMAASSGMSDAEIRDLNLFLDLLERCLNLNPDKRITPNEALKHPFFTSRVHLSGR